MPALIERTAQQLLRELCDKTLDIVKHRTPAYEEFSEGLEAATSATLRKYGLVNGANGYEKTAAAISRRVWWILANHYGVIAYPADFGSADWRYVAFREDKEKLYQKDPDGLLRKYGQNVFEILQHD